MLDDTKKGKPHGLHILQKYRNKTNNLPRVLPPDADFLRTFKGIEQKHNEYVAAGAQTAKAMNFENCINKPLLKGIGTAAGAMIDTYSCTPLHISLGIGLQILNIIENQAIQLDKEIWESEGAWEPYSQLLTEKSRLLRRCATLERTIEDRDDSIAERKERQMAMKTGNPRAFEKNGRRLVDKTVAARKIRNDYEVLAGEVESF
jgi:hypothetical protein